MADSRRWIQRHWKRLQWGQFLGVCADRLSLGLIILGCAILLVKLFIPSMWPYALWWAALLILIPIWSWQTVKANRFRESEATALLDRKLNAGGLLMTLAEAPDEQWQLHLPKVEQMWRNSLPRIRPKRFFSHVTVPLIFAVVTCFVPLREFSSVLATPRKVSQQTTDELETMLKTMEEADILKEEEKEELKEELEKFIEETHDKPLTHEQWETADSLRQQMQMIWEKNERGVDLASNAIDELMSEMANGGEISAEKLEQLQQTLGENLQNMAQQAMKGGMPEMSDALKEALQQAAETGQLQLPADQAAREKMLQELQQMLKKESEKLARKRGEGEGGEPGDMDGGQGEGQFNNNPGQDRDGPPGKGGINRGRGDASMMWGEEADLANSKFKDVVLPEGIRDEATEEVLGITKHEPEVDPAAGVSKLPVRENDPAAGRATWNRKLNPKHRDVVRKFFNSERATQAIPEDQGL